LEKINIELNDTRNYQIFSQYWKTEEKLKANILLVHGLGEHSGRYATHFAEFFTNEGFSILTFDLPGHGKSSGKRGHIEKDDDFNKIINSVINYLRVSDPIVPIFLYGHSLGGLIVLDYLLEEKPQIKGVISTAPVLDTFKPIAPAKVKLAKKMKNILPSLSLDSGLDRSQLSRDEDVISAYNEDPLVHGATSARLGSYIIERGKYVLENLVDIELPSLVMVGTDEGIVSVNAINQFCESSPNCTKKIWKGLYHELHNEPEKSDVMQYTAKWMTAQLR